MRVTTNQFGAKINRCCASCRFKEPTRLMTKRLCTKTNQEVNPFDVCTMWRMNDQVKRAGYGGGRVKRKDYLLYLAKIREEEMIRQADGEQFEPKSISQIRAAFQQEFGSIYLIK